MNINAALLSKNPLFYGIAAEELEGLLQSLCAYSKQYEKDAYILSAGDPVKVFGLVLSGSIHILKEDFSGSSQLLAQLSPPDVFAEVFASAGIPESPVTVQAAQRCTVLFIPYEKFIAPGVSCKFHMVLVKNMLRLLAGKNLLLNQKIDILSKRTIRERLLLYLRAQCGSSGKCTLALNRQELADFLCVDRSALSNELSKLQKEGILRVHKNQFAFL